MVSAEPPAGFRSRALGQGQNPLKMNTFCICTTWGVGQCPHGPPWIGQWMKGQLFAWCGAFSLTFALTDCTVCSPRSCQQEPLILCRLFSFCFCVLGSSGQTIMTPADKRTLIFNPPAILSVHLKRFEQVCLIAYTVLICFYRASSYASAVLAVVTVILSVRLSVCHTRALWQNQTMYCGYFDATRKDNHSSFLTPTNLRSKWPTPFQKRRLRQISAYSVSTVRDSKKVQSWRIWSRPWAFQRAIDGVRTLPLSLQRVAQKAIFCFFDKIQLQSNKVCQIVSLCEDFQRQSCTTISLSNGPRTMARDITLQPQIAPLS